MRHRQESKTIELARSGDQHAFRALYQTHRPRVYATVYRFVRNDADAEDLVQVTFLKAFQGMARFRGEAAFSTWITRIALNVSHSHHEWVSAQKRCAPQPDRPQREPISNDDPEQALYAAECRRRVLQLIRRLPRKYRRVMAMRYVADYSYAEIEAALSVPMGTVKTWLWRGRQLLREHADPERARAA